MATWTDVLDSNLLPDQPGRSADIIAIKDNVVFLNETKYIRTILTTGTSWTVPSGVYKIRVYTLGGGGGSGTCSATGSGGAGGGAGGLSIKDYSVTPGDVFSYSIGTGGTAGTTEPQNGGTGGTTIFNTTQQATGGTGGAYTQTGTLQPDHVGFGGVGSGGDINLRGENGQPSDVLHDGTAYLTGQGGNSPFGYGGVGNRIGTDTNGNNGNGYGSGAGGAISSSAPENAGGTGATGAVIIEY